MQNVTESLAGRTGIINLCPLSANELTKAGIMPSLEEYVSAGGYPVLYGDKEVGNLQDQGRFSPR